MITQKCINCNIEKTIDEYYKNKNWKSGIHGQCKECVSEKAKNKRKICGNAIRERDRNYYKVNSKRVKEKNRKSRNKHIIRHREQQKQYYLNRREYILSKALKWQKENREKRNIYFKNKRANDINYRLRAYLGGRIYTVLKKNIKSARTEVLVGCTMGFLKRYLERKFQKGMTWKNQGSWHIDHIIPCISFDLSKEEEQRQCFHYSNLQPLWAKDNFSKQAKIIEGTQMKIAI